MSSNSLTPKRSSARSYPRLGHVKQQKMDEKVNLMEAERNKEEHR